MKSAYELAMSRLEKNQPTSALSEEQKSALAEIDSEYAAKIAERRIFLDGEIAKSLGDQHSIDQLRRQIASECALLEEKREQRKEKIRGGKTA
jgi:sRNA-binding protein